MTSCIDFYLLAFVKFTPCHQFPHRRRPHISLPTCHNRFKLVRVVCDYQDLFPSGYIRGKCLLNQFLILITCLKCFKRGGQQTSERVFTQNKASSLGDNKEVMKLCFLMTIYNVHVPLICNVCPELLRHSSVVVSNLLLIEHFDY